MAECFSKYNASHLRTPDPARQVGRAFIYSKVLKTSVKSRFSSSRATLCLNLKFIGQTLVSTQTVLKSLVNTKIEITTGKCATPTSTRYVDSHPSLKFCISKRTACLQSSWIRTWIAATKVNSANTTKDLARCWLEESKYYLSLS